MFDGSTVLVTGGTGSFGKSCVEKLLNNFKPTKIIVYSRDELKQYEMQSSEPFSGEKRLRYFIGDIRDARRLEMAFRGVDFVIHTAALKHVTAAEYNPFECIHTNVLGAENVVHAALSSSVKKVLALSTDKAVNPINLYGASKLASDKIFVAANHLSGSTGARFSVARYGNVLGSRGSVVPMFLKLKENNSTSIPITDRRMTRFSITLDAAVDFVLSSLEMMIGGEIFVPKIPSMRIVDLASTIAPDAQQKEVGIRPGEKLHEVLVTDDDARSTIEFHDRFVIEPLHLLMWGSNVYEQKGGAKVMAGFNYMSNTNDDFLDVESIRRILCNARIY